MATTLGMVQPFRYRGYVFDEETQLYYLRSRYFSSCWCKFLNTDSIAELKLVSSTYTYCKNSPIMRIDADGTESHINTMYLVADPRYMYGIAEDRVTGEWIYIQRGDMVCSMYAVSDERYIREYRPRGGDCIDLSDASKINVQHMRFVHYKPWSAIDVFGPDNLGWAPDTYRTEVYKLQIALVMLGYDIGTPLPDGYFGPGTLSAVKAFQNNMKPMYPGINTNGEVDSQTKDALFARTYPIFDFMQEQQEAAINDALY